jgi:hypothetical protein
MTLHKPDLEEAQRRFREARTAVAVQRQYEGRSTKTGNQTYQNGYDAAETYIVALEARIVELTTPQPKHRKVPADG